MTIPPPLPPTILVTGATGFIGRRLMADGVRAFTRGATTLAGAVTGDLLDPTSLAAACQDIKCVFHCAGFAHSVQNRDDGNHWKINYEGTCNLLRAAGEAGVKKFIFLSSVRAMAAPGDYCVDEDWAGEPKTSDGIAKRAAECAVLEAGQRYGMHVVNLRLSMVYGKGGRGNLERLARGLTKSWVPVPPETSNRRSLVHVDDVIRAVHLAAASPQANGRTYIVCHPTPYSGRELCEEILKILPFPEQRHWEVPECFLRLGARIGDFAQIVLRRNLPLNSTVVSRLLDSECYSPSRIERELGWVAQVDLRAGLQEMLLS